MATQVGGWMAHLCVEEKTVVSFADWFYNSLFGYPLPQQEPKSHPMADALRQSLKDSQEAAQKEYQAHYAQVLLAHQWAERSEAHSSSY